MDFKSSTKKQALINSLTEKFVEIMEGPLSLDKAILLATISHAGQTDKGDNSYIRHPLRVMEAMSSESEMICAVMHDTLEDTPLTPEDLLLLGFTLDQIKVLDCLTNRAGETYEDFIIRIKKSSTASAIKLQDLFDNLKFWRLKNVTLTENDTKRIQKYIFALAALGGLDKKYDR